MITLTAESQSFCLIGIASHFKLKNKNRIQGFDLMTAQGKYRFKIPAKLHKELDIELYPLMRLEVRGIVWTDPKKQKVKLKIQQITPLPPAIAGDRPPAQLTESAAPNTQQSIQAETHITDQPLPNAKLPQPQKHKILICKKSNCWKKGGRLACEKLQKTIDKKGLRTQVTIKTTGCMDRCKKAPNVVVMPDKEKYTNFEPDSAELLIERHFGELQENLA